MNLVLPELTPRQQRVAASGLLILTLLVIVLGVTLPARALHQHYDDALAQRTDRLRRELRLISMAPALKKQLTDLRSLDASRYYLRSANPVLAAAEVQEVVKRLVDANGCKLVSVNILPPRDDGAVTAIGINVQLSGPLPGVEAVFYGLETAKPYLLLDNVSIRSLNGYPVPNATPSVAQLQVQFDLDGFLRKAAP